MAHTAIIRAQSRNEEIANSLSHGLGAVAAAVFSPQLITNALSAGTVHGIAAMIYCASMILLFSVSAAYHWLPQGSTNAVCLPAALRFNAVAVPDAVARFAQALGVENAPARAEELARLGGFGRLRDLDVPEADLDDVAEAVVLRRGALENPRPATAAEVAELLRSVW